MKIEKAGDDSDEWEDVEGEEEEICEIDHVSSKAVNETKSEPAPIANVVDPHDATSKQETLTPSETNGDSITTSNDVSAIETQIKSSSIIESLKGAISDYRQFFSSTTIILTIITVKYL